MRLFPGGWLALSLVLGVGCGAPPSDATDAGSDGGALAGDAGVDGGTKSFTCALYAVGTTKGYWTLETRAADIITEWQTVPRKQDILLKHLLSLSSGLSEAPGYNPLTVRNLDTYSLGINGTTADFAPDQAAIYTPTTFQVMAAMLERKNGGVDPVTVLEENVFSKLGIAPDSAHDTASKWTRDNKGKPQMAGGASLSAREWARYGLLMANHGVWNGEQVLDAARVDECWSYRPPAFLGYGLTWWLNRPNEGTYDPGVDHLPADGLGDGMQLASNAPADMAIAAGAGKQRLYVIRSLDVIVVRFGRNNTAFSDHQLLGALLGQP